MEALVRPLTRADAAQYAALDAFAFQADEKEVRRLWTASPPSGVGAFASGTGRLLAALQIWPFLSFFQGRPIPTGGVASVASWPEVRRQGLVARLLRESLSMMRAEGQVISLLYPFAYPFYRRYGWELAFSRTLYRIPLGELDPFRRPPPGRFRRAEPDDLPAVDALYRRFVSRWNGPLLREATWWRDRILFRTGPAGTGPRRTVLWEAGPRVRAYLVYGFQAPSAPTTVVEGAPARVLHVYDWAVEDGDAMRALFSFLVQHDSMAGQLALPAPSDWDLLPLLVNPRIEVRRSAGAMARIVDMDRFLEGLLPPTDEPSSPEADPALPEAAVQLQVTDEVAPWNHGRWLLPLTGGRPVRLPQGAGEGQGPREAPILKGSIQVWSQVLTGYLPALQAWRLRLLDLEMPGIGPWAAPETAPDPEDPMGTDRPLWQGERFLQAFDERLGLRATYLPDSF